METSVFRILLFCSMLYFVITLLVWALLLLNDYAWTVQFGGIYASRLAKHFRIPIRHFEKEEKLLPPTFLDHKSMVAHEFIVKNNEMMLKYNLRFNKTHSETIILLAPSLFDLSSGTYLILPEAVHTYRSQTSAPEPELKPPLDPYRQSFYQWDPEEIASQWHSDDTPQYTGESNSNPWA